MHWIEERELQLRGSQWLVKWGAEAIKDHRGCKFNKYTSDRDEDAASESIYTARGYWRYIFLMNASRAAGNPDFPSSEMDDRYYWPRL